MQVGDEEKEEEEEEEEEQEQEEEGGEQTVHTELCRRRIGSSGGTCCERCLNLGSATRDLFN